ncbi:hypothetical protein GCM10017673_14790 [Streptosporangium violaceochromogenes]|nr:hypothetical protein GCM10017673_14790 [Streptosporangium violaceochromogenes]
MAVDQDLLDQIAGTIADLYREVEASLITVISDELKKGLDAPTAEIKLDAIGKLRRASQVILASLQAARAGAVREAIARAYRNGHASALTNLPETWFPKSRVGQDARQALKQVPNAAVIESLAQALHRDLGRVDGNILRAPIDAYRAVQAGTAARIVTGTATRRQASQAAWQRLVDRGIVSFTDRAGRQWRLSSYVEMVGRTNAQRAMVQGQTDRLASAGIDLVYVSDNTQECKLCRPFEGRVLRRGPGRIGRIKVEHATRDGELVEVDVVDTLDGARGRGFQHPNCRHSISAYLPGVTRLKKGTADPTGDQARQKQRALERRIRAAKEQALGALDEPAKKAARARVRAAQGDLRAHLKTNPKLKRLPYREQVGAGNIPGPGGPKGGPVTDLQPPVQPTLDGAPGARITAPGERPVKALIPDGPRAGQLSLDDAPKVEAPKVAPKKAEAPKVEVPEVPAVPKAEPKPPLDTTAQQNQVRERHTVDEAAVRARYERDIAAQRELMERKTIEARTLQDRAAAAAANLERFAARDRITNLERRRETELLKLRARRDAELHRLTTGQPRPAARGDDWLSSQVAEGEAGREKLSGGSIASTSRVTFKDGTKAIHKKADDIVQLDAIHQTDAEELGALVARALGVPAPRTRRTAVDEIYLELMPGRIGHEAKKPRQHWLTPDGRRIALLDQLIDYPDRHDANWLVHDGRLTSIDHGLAFGYHGRPGQDRRPGEPRFRYEGPFEKLFVKKPRREGDPGEWADNDLTAEDIAAVRARLDAIREAFEDAGRTEWHDRMLTVLDELARHAKGVTPWLPDLGGDL